jgi:3'-phosphoadenosine 5'-phosphosulfate (PAPS) 3'-phosphatase
MNEKQLKIIKYLQLKILRAGGAGFKILKLIKNEVDSVLFIDMKTSKWDSCAGEAIIKAMGGQSIKPNLSEISYDKNSST